MSAPRSRLAVIVVGLFAVAAAVSTAHPETESDTFWHMMLGRAVLRAKSRIVPEPTAMVAFTRDAVVPEWAYGVMAYLVHHVAGFVGLGVVIATLAAATVILTRSLVRAAAPTAGLGLTIALTGVVAGSAIIRIRNRPEAFATPLLLAFLVLAYRFVDEVDARRRAWLGAALVAVTLAWAQIHGSFILAPAIFFLFAAGRLARERDPITRQAYLATLGGLVVTLVTTAYGLDLAGYLAVHAGGDASRHVSDMTTPSFAIVDPARLVDAPSGGFLLGLLTLGVAGMLARRTVYWREIALACVGCALATNAVRFIAIAPIFALPLAARAGEAFAEDIGERALWLSAGVGAAIGVVGMALPIRGIHARFGPIGRIGPAESRYPTAAARWLERLPPGSAVFTTYNAGGSLGFWLDGRVRTYVDARTPLYFDDADFAIARELLGNPAALPWGLARYDAAAAVVNRDVVCHAMPPSFAPVIVESHFTTFARAPAPGDVLTQLQPCGTSYLRPRACEDAKKLDAEIDRMEALHPTAFVRYLRADRILRCGGDLARAAALLPTRGDSAGFLAQRDGAEAAYWVRSHDLRRALDVVATSDVDATAAALTAIGPALDRAQGDLGPARAAVERALDAMDDRAPAEIRGLLALLCAKQGDTDCAREQATRAAVRGSRSALPVLTWLAANAPTQEQQSDAKAWLDLLTTAPASPTKAP